MHVKYDTVNKLENSPEIPVEVHRYPSHFSYLVWVC